jgi:hypothetical protein
MKKLLFLALAMLLGVTGLLLHGLSSSGADADATAATARARDDDSPGRRPAPAGVGDQTELKRIIRQQTQ